MQNSQVLTTIEVFFSSSTRHPLVNQAIDLLEMVKAATKNITSVSGLFMDELACVFNSEESIDKNLLAWISEIMADDFQGKKNLLLNNIYHSKR